MTDKKKLLLSRRGFLGVSAAGAATAAGIAGCGEDGDPASVTGTAGAGGQPPAPQDSGLPPDLGVDVGTIEPGTDAGPDVVAADSGEDAAEDAGQPPALVGLARGPSVRTAVQEAIALTAGLSFISNSDTVLLKPNLNSGDPFPYSTNPEVVVAMIELARDHGAGRIIVADRSNPAYTTLDAMSRSGITDAVQSLGVEILDLDSPNVTRVTPALATNWPNGFETYSLLLDEVDHVINLPACKHHSMANFTMALKAWMGIITQDDRSTAHQDLGNRLPELHLGRAASFTVMDATRACLTRGPMPGGEQASPDIVVATPDPIACDVTGLAILKYWLAQNGISNGDIDDYGVWDQPQIARALEIGIGIGSRTEYEARATGIDEFDALLQTIQA